MNDDEFKDARELLKKMGKDLAHKRVLIVDRHTSARNTLRIMLSALGISRVHNAGSSSEVLRLVQNDSFDIILADYNLDDGRDGQQLLEELRQKQLISRSTIYMIISAERAYHNVVSVAELSPDAFLIKPFTTDQLHNRLARAIHKKQFFAPIFELLDNNLFSDALGVCEKLSGKKTVFDADLLRLKGEILNSLGRYTDALAVYQHALSASAAPWARMGLAIALRGLERLPEAETLGVSLLKSHPQYLAVYDFIASVREEMGRLPEAQEVLQQAALNSPKNALRQRQVGHIAMRNKDYDIAERAYAKVLERRRTSSLRQIDDYTNLSRVMLSKGRTDNARVVMQELRRDWRGNEHGELAALIVDSLCCSQEGEVNKAKQALEQALTLQHNLENLGAIEISKKISIDLAHACLNVGDEAQADEILSKVAAENNDDRDAIAQIQHVFAQVGREDEGQSLLAKVSDEIVELNNQGVLAARSGDLETSVEMLSETADRVPSLQFLINAAKAIFTWLEKNEWDDEMAQRGLHYLNKAQEKDPSSSKVISAHELYLQVSRQYGLSLSES